MLINYINYNKKWKLLKEILRNKLPKYQQALAKEERFCTFFKHTLLPRRLVSKFDVVIHNNKKHYLTGQISSFFTPKNKKIIKILMRGYLIFFFAVLYGYKHLDYKKIGLADKIYDISIFNNFNDNNFNEYYYNNKYLEYLIKGYALDKDYFDTFINYYNFSLFLNLGLFEVILNFEYYKYEDDKILYSNPNIKNYKNKKKVLMHTDFFDYIERKNRTRDVNKYTWDSPFYNLDWNIIDKDEDDLVTIHNKKTKKDLKNHLMWQDNLFFCWSIYEFALNIYNKDLLFNYFNSDFFSKVEIYSKKNKNENYKYPYFLTSTYHNYNYEYLNLKKKRNSVINKVLYTDYKKLKFNLADKFDLKQHILDIKYFGIKIPFLLFLLRPWYWVCYRRKRYDFYIRGDIFFQEHFSKIKYFIDNNISRRSLKSTMKFPIWNYQILNTVNHFKSYLEVGLFNDLFFLYSSYHIPLFININLNKGNVSNFVNLLNIDNISNLLQLVNEKKTYYLDFFYEYAISYHYMYELFNAYELFMDTPITKYEPTLKFGKFSYLNYHDMIEKSFLGSTDRSLFVRYLEKIIMEKYFCNIYFNLNYYFFNDFFKLNKTIEPYLKTSNFYEQVVNIIFLLIDPFFFKYFLKRCFPGAWHKLRSVQEFIFDTIIMQQIDSNSFQFNIPKYSFLMHYLNWRIDTGNFVTINNFNSNKISQDFIIVNQIYENRFIELITQFNFLLKKATVTKTFKYYYIYYLTTLKNYYFDLLYNNIEYSLLFFFNNIQKYLNLIQGKPTNLCKFIYSNFIYKHYIYTILLESHYYDNWFVDKEKRKFWILRNKNYNKHEGPRFYKKQVDII